MKLVSNLENHPLQLQMLEIIKRRKENNLCAGRNIFRKKYDPDNLAIITFLKQADGSAYECNIDNGEYWKFDVAVLSGKGQGYVAKLYMYPYNVNWRFRNYAKIIMQKEKGEFAEENLIENIFKYSYLSEIKLHKIDSETPKGWYYIIEKLLERGEYVPPQKYKRTPYSPEKPKKVFKL